MISRCYHAEIAIESWYVIMPGLSCDRGHLGPCSRRLGLEDPNAYQAPSFRHTKRDRISCGSSSAARGAQSSKRGTAKAAAAETPTTPCPRRISRFTWCPPCWRGSSLPLPTPSPRCSRAERLRSSSSLCCLREEYEMDGLLVIAGVVMDGLLVIVGVGVLLPVRRKYV